MLGNNVLMQLGGTDDLTCLMFIPMAFRYRSCGLSVLTLSGGLLLLSSEALAAISDLVELP